MHREQDVKSYGESDENNREYKEHLQNTEGTNRHFTTSLNKTTYWVEVVSHCSTRLATSNFCENELIAKFAKGFYVTKITRLYIQYRKSKLDKVISNAWTLYSALPFPAISCCIARN